MMRDFLSRAKLDFNRALPTYSYANHCLFALILVFKGLQTLQIVENEDEKVKTVPIFPSNAFNVIAIRRKR